MVEVPCVVNADGARPLAIGPVPRGCSRSRHASQGLRAPHGRRGSERLASLTRNARSRPIRWSVTPGTPRASSPHWDHGERPIALQRRLDRALGLVEATATNILGDDRRRAVPHDPVHAVVDGRPAHPVRVARRRDPGPLRRSGVRAARRRAARQRRAVSTTSAKPTGPLVSATCSASSSSFRRCWWRRCRSRAARWALPTTCGFYWTGMTAATHHTIAALVPVVMTALLYREHP